MEKKWSCDSEGCDQRHCRKCGHHFEPEPGATETCPDCVVGRAMAEMEAVTKAFGGDYEKAAKFMGW